MTASRRHPGPPKGNQNAAKPPGEARSVWLTVRFRPAELEACRTAAKRAGLSLPAWVREKLRDATTSPFTL